MSAPQPERSPVPFGKHLLFSRISTGGMAEVWLGKLFGMGGTERLEAVKRILPEVSADQDFITMFVDEAKISVQLSHPNIGRVYDFGKIDNSYFISLEYIAGLNLRGVFDHFQARKEQLPIPLSCYIIAKLCEGLDYAHRRTDRKGGALNIVHRDVSPHNVLIGWEGEVKLIDFGIAKAKGKANKTHVGFLKGKFGYMSPEQIKGLPLDRRSDIFSAGICLYELLTGTRAFEEETDAGVVDRVVNAAVPEPASVNPKIPEALSKIVLKAMARNVDERYQWANELAEDLEQVLVREQVFLGPRDLSEFMKASFPVELDVETSRLKAAAELTSGGMSLGSQAAALAGPTEDGGIGDTLIRPKLGRTEISGPRAKARAERVQGSGPRRTSQPKVPPPRVESSRPLVLDQEPTAVVMPSKDATTELRSLKSTLVDSPGVSRGAPAGRLAGARAWFDFRLLAQRFTSRQLLGAGAGLLCAWGVLVAFALKGQQGYVWVNVPPEVRDSARVTIDGREIPKGTGEIFEKVSVGKVIVLVAAPGFEPYAQEVQVKGGAEVAQVYVELRPVGRRGKLAVVVDPPGAEIQLDGQVVKRGGTKSGIYVGEVELNRPYRLRVSLAGWRPSEQTVQPTDAEEPTRVSVGLERAPAQ